MWRMRAPFAMIGAFMWRMRTAFSMTSAFMWRVASCFWRVGARARRRGPESLRALACPRSRLWSYLVIMHTTSLANAKAHLSELVDEAEHRGKRIMILRHGKPAAAIVPIDVATPKPAKPRPMSTAEARALLDELGRLGDPSGEAVRDLLESRR